MVVVVVVVAGIDDIEEGALAADMVLADSMLHAGGEHMAHDVHADLVAVGRQWRASVLQTCEAIEMIETTSASDAFLKSAGNLSLLLLGGRDGGDVLLVHWQGAGIGQRVYLDEERRLKHSVAPVAGTPILPATPGIALASFRVPYEDFSAAECGVECLVADVGTAMRKRSKTTGRAELAPRVLRLMSLLETLQSHDVAGVGECCVCMLADGALACPLCLMRYHHPDCSERAMRGIKSSAPPRPSSLPSWYRSSAGLLLDSCCASCRAWVAL